MKKHQTIAIISIVALAAIVAIIIFLSKKTTEVPAAPTTTEQVTQTVPETVTSAPKESIKSTVPTSPKPVQDPNTYTMAQVAIHNSRTSCYTAISGSVYDLTTWIGEHPGGQFAILSLCGKDGTEAFNNQHDGQARPESELTSFKIGTLVQ